MVKLKPVKDENGKLSISEYEVPSFDEKEQTVRVRVRKFGESENKALAGAHFELKRIANADRKTA